MIRLNPIFLAVANLVAVAALFWIVANVDACNVYPGVGVGAYPA